MPAPLPCRPQCPPMRWQRPPALTPVEPASLRPRFLMMKDAPMKRELLMARVRPIIWSLELLGSGAVGGGQGPTTTC